MTRTAPGANEGPISGCATGWCPWRLIGVVLGLSVLFLGGCADTHTDPPIDETERFPGGATTNTLLLGSNAFIRPVSNLEEDNEAAFYTGNSFFNQAWVEAPASTTVRDGLGPFFNARACSSCHPRDGRAEPPTEPGQDFLGLLLRLSIPGEDETGGPKAHPVYGDQFHQNSILDVPAEGTPILEYETISGTFDDGEPYELTKPVYRIEDLNYGPLGQEIMLSPRIGPQVIGMGLLDAIPEQRLRELADPNDDDGDGISGRINMVWDIAEQTYRPGRFGWKGEATTVRQQVAAAFAGDIGISTPLIPKDICGADQPECSDALSGGEPEIDARLFEFVVLYTSLVAVPVRRKWQDPDVLAGKALFNQIGCGDCHVGKHQTGAHEYAEVSNQTIWPYTDLLLHDMGEGLSDNRPVYDANGREWKTPPLWGLGLIEKVNRHTRFLHDGRARNLTEAILWHGGEADPSQRAFKALSSVQRQQLITFVESL